MDIPGFDPKVFTDQQLLDKETELHKRIAYAARFAGADTIQQFQNFLQAIATERMERLVHSTWEMRQKMFPDVIESDPDMIEKKDSEIETKDAVRSGRRVGRDRLGTKVIMEKSSTPTTNLITPNKK
jgi:hypothetical protein